MAASATFALKAGVWFRRGRLFIVSPDSRDTACPLSGRNSTYRPVQILEAGAVVKLRMLELLTCQEAQSLSGREMGRRYAAIWRTVFSSLRRFCASTHADAT